MRRISIVTVLVAAAAAVLILMPESVPYGPGCRDAREVGLNEPADLVAHSAKECQQEARWDEAAGLAVLAGLLAEYDAERVANPSASAVVARLRDGISGEAGSDTADRMRAAQARLDEAGSARHAAFCAAMAERGPPDYRPVYMLAQLGMQERADWAVPGFNGAAVWARLLAEKANCPA